MSDDQDFAPDTVLLIQAATSGAKLSRTLSFDDLFGYATGILNEDEASRVELVLTRSAEYRSQLSRIHQSVARLSRNTVPAIDSPSTGDSLEDQIVEAWRGMVRRLISGAVPFLEWWSKEDWDSAVDKIRGRAADAFCSAGALWQLARRPPLLTPATVRSAGGAVFEIPGISPSPRVGIQAEIDADGTLHALFTIQSGQTALHGQEIAVLYGDAGYALPIFRTRVSGREIELTLPGFGLLTGHLPGDLDGGYFSIAVGDVPPPGGEGRILAEVAGYGFPDRIQIQFTEGGRIEERLVLDVAIPSAALERYPDGILQLDLVLAPHLTLRLGQWPLSEWVDGPRRLEIELPGITDSFRAIGCVLSAEIHP